MVKEKYIGWLLVLPAVIMVFGLTLYPLFNSVYYSTRDTNLKTGQDEYIDIRNYSQLLHRDPNLANSAYRTLIFTVVCLGVEIPLGLGIALLLNRKIKGRGIFRAIIILPLMAAPIAIGQVWRIMYHYEFGVIPYLVSSVFGASPNFTADPGWALGSLMIFDWWQWTPFVFLIMLAGLQSLSPDPYESATIYGASTIQKFRHITLPKLRALIAFVIVFRTIDLLKTYDSVVAITWGGPGRATELLSYYLYRVGFWYFQVGYACAISLIFLYVVIVFSIIVLKKIAWW